MISNSLFRHWDRIQIDAVKKLKSVRNYLWINTGIYLGLFFIEYSLSKVSHSQMLFADALNNLSGIFSTGLLMTGIYIASKTRDDDLLGAPISVAEQKSLGPRIQQSRFQFENIYTLISGVLMIAIALNIDYSGFKSILSHHQVVPNSLGAMGAIISFALLLVSAFLTKHGQKKLNDATLDAAAKDIFSDVLTSLVAFITICGSILIKQSWLDGVTSILLGFYILYSGLSILKKSSLDLVGYFDPKLEQSYRETIEEFPEVQRVIFIRARYDGNLIMLDVVIQIDKRMTVTDIYKLSQLITNIMQQRFGIVETNVMVYPSNLA